MDSVAFSGDGKLLASGGGDDHTVKLWEVTAAKEKATLKGHSGPVRSVAFSGNTLLASGSLDGTVKLWDVTAAKEKATLRGHASAVHSVVFSPDGMTLVSGSGIEDDEKKVIGGEVKLWDVATGKEKATLKGHRQTVYSMAISGDGKLLATGGLEGSVILWNVETGRERATFKSPAFASVAMSSDGKLLAVGGYSTKVMVWDVTAGKEKTNLAGHKAIVPAVAFSRDGKRLASASHDGTVVLWDIPTVDADK